MKRAKSAEGCPCGRPRAYAECCGRWHAGEPAPDAESLMRSRYSAFVLGLDDYLGVTWHPSTRPASVGDPDRAITRWLGLEVRRVDPTTVDEDGVGHARVEFVARCRVGGRGHRLHEDSRFVREDGCWYYVDGDHR